MRRTRILLVDDNASIRATLQEIIEENPSWRICGQAGEGRTAVDLARTLRPDLIILDYHMPKLDGVEAARRILRFAPETPIVFFTAEISRHVARQVVEVGVQAVVTKGGGGYLDLLACIEKLSAENRDALSSRRTRNKKR